jgi:alpha-glucosidase
MIQLARRFLLISTAMLLVHVARSQSMPVSELGNVSQVRLLADTLLLRTDQAEARIWVYSPTVIRVRVTKPHAAKDTSFAVIQQPTKISYQDADSVLEVKTPMIKLVISKRPMRFKFYTADGKSLSEDDQRFGINWQNARVTSYRRIFPDERFIGLGEKTGNLDRRGQSYVNWNTDAGLNNPSTDPLYETYPFYMGLHSGLTYGIFLDNPAKTYFNFGASTDNRMSWFGAESGDMNYYFFGAQQVADIVRDYTWLTGRMEMPPLWSLGYQQSRYSYASAKEVLEIAQTFRSRHIPADVLYCDIDYMDRYKIFTWNKTTFPDPKAMIDKLKAKNYHLVTIVDPGIKVEKGYDKYDEGMAHNFFARYPNGEPYIGDAWPGRIHFPDFTDAAVRKWWGGSFTTLTHPGVEGFWNDMNEPSTWGQDIPAMVQLGRFSMPEVRNVYGMQMARATYDGARALLGNQRPFVLTRAAYAGTQRYSAVWTGDNSPYDAHMLLGQRLVNTLGLAGMAFAGVDIGGFSGNVTAELLVRWNSLGVYTPMFRNHTSIETAYREPWRWGAANEQIIKTDIEERYRLLPYLYSSFYQAHTTGMPVSRSLVINYSQDANIYNEKFQNEFLFGDNILVAPVISTVNKAEVYLPQGNWYRKGTDSLYTGGKSYQVAAPLNNLPVFVKAGAIVPKQHVVESTADKGDGILELHIWNGPASTFVYYEDDGQTYNYQQGNFYKRQISFNPAQQQLSLTQVTGAYQSKYTKLRLVLHGFQSIKGWQANGKTYKADDANTVILPNTNKAIQIKFK